VRPVQKRAVRAQPLLSMASSLDVVVPPPPSLPTPEEPCRYALLDDEYSDWKTALSACQQAPDSVEGLRSLASRPKLLNWRSPISGQTLLHELASRGASESTIEAAVELGCQRAMRNARGEDVGAIVARKRTASGSGEPRAFLGSGLASAAFMGSDPRGLAAGGGGTAGSSRQRRSQWSSTEVRVPDAMLRSPTSVPPPVPQQRQRSSLLQTMASKVMPWKGRSEREGVAASAPRLSTSEASREQFPLPWSSSASPSPFGATSASSAPSALGASSVSSVRKAGQRLASSEVASVPKARMNMNLNVDREEDLDVAQLSRSIAEVYGGSARVQIDEVVDSPAPSGVAFLSAFSSPQVPRRQTVSCRVMFDNAEEAKTWQATSMCSRTVQTQLAAGMAWDGSAVEFDDGGVQLDTVDAITLKLDSDSSHILCGACLLYTSQEECAQVVCYNDRYAAGGAVTHSGDTTVDGKSVHAISVVMSKVPPEITQLYFTICSCGPSDLSGFKSPSIMLYENAQPDANLLEYSIEQAANSLSSVMARMVRRPVWSATDRACIASGLRKVKMPLLCIDLCMSMAAETTWDIQALGMPEWNLNSKVCSNYDPGMALIADHLQRKTAVATSRVSTQGRPGGAADPTASSSSAAAPRNGANE